MKILFFCVGSALLILVSRTSLTHPRSHGFYRFFAWEFMWLLLLTNVSHWFKNPFSFYQIISWTLLFASAGLALYGFYQFRRMGQADSIRKDAVILDFEKTTVLITTGLYQYIRHPLYGSLLLLTWGIFFKRLTWFGLAWACLATLFLFLTAWREEEENLAYFGPAYRDYMKRSKRFIPFLF